MLSALFGMCTRERDGSSRALTRGVKHKHLHSILPKIPGIALLCTQIYTENDKATSGQGRKLHFSSPLNPQAPAVWVCQISSKQECEAWVLLQTQIWSLCCQPITAWLFRSVMDDLPLLGVFTEEIRYLSKMRYFNLVSGRNPALGGIKHRFNNPNNSFWH